MPTLSEVKQKKWKKNDKNSDFAATELTFPHSVQILATQQTIDILCHFKSRKIGFLAVRTEEIKKHVKKMLSSNLTYVLYQRTSENSPLLKVLYLLLPNVVNKKALTHKITK